MTGLVQRMRERTAALHAEAEQTGIVAALLAGQVGRDRYALYLRSLLPVYQAMEHALPRRADLAALTQPALFRAAAIRADLESLVGPDWLATLPLLASADAYARRVEHAANGAALIAHCYTRYLGDLSGGQIIGRRLARQFGAICPALAFTAFPDIDDISHFARSYRAALDRGGEVLEDAAHVIEEAAIAFQLNIAVSQDVGNFRTGVDRLTP